jgi:hypothetical protein
MLSAARRIGPFAATKDCPLTANSPLLVIAFCAGRESFKKRPFAGYGRRKRPFGRVISGIRVRYVSLHDTQRTGCDPFAGCMSTE